MQDTSRMMTASNISLGDIGMGILLGLWPGEIPTLPPPHEISYSVITLGESCYNHTWSKTMYKMEDCMHRKKDVKEIWHQDGSSQGDCNSSHTLLFTWQNHWRNHQPSPAIKTTLLMQTTQKRKVRTPHHDISWGQQTVYTKSRKKKQKQFLS